MIDVNKVYCLDCLAGMRMIDACSVDLVVTDPPYFIQALQENLSQVSLRKSGHSPIFHADWDHFPSLVAYKGFISGVLDEFANRRLMQEALIKFF